MTLMGLASNVSKDCAHRNGRANSQRLDAPLRPARGHAGFGLGRDTGSMHHRITSRTETTPFSGEIRVVSDLPVISLIRAT